MITKSEIVLHRRNEKMRFGVVVFECREHTKHFLELPKEAWADMGEPGIITVTIQPGDLLNEEQT